MLKEQMKRWNRVREDMSELFLASTTNFATAKLTDCSM